ncbi:MAG TPA: hypothetical protein EYM90_05050, partial [Phycisphaerales bacterium]|nr:hypothetical protein [Phycisphaerales bacterium]
MKTFSEKLIKFVAGGLCSIGMYAGLSGMNTGYSTLVVGGNGQDNFNSIQEAINYIDWSNPTEIIILPGTYHDIHQQVIDTKGLVIWLHSSDGPDVTFIDGQNLKRCVFVRFQETSSTIFEGLTFINGYAQHGAGMWVANGSPQVLDCVFKNNVSYGFGGGMYVNASSSPTVTNCSFINNSALDGGGLKNASNGTTFLNCMFTQNSAENGGAIQNYASTGTYTDCSMTGNTASETGGGVHNIFGTTSQFVNCIIDFNSAQIGGGVRNESLSNPVFTSTIINSNSATIGGGIENENSSPEFISCEVKLNTDTVGGMASFLKSNPVLIDSNFCQNTPVNISGPFT